MILVTVGSQAPFDRLIRAADDWARTRKRSDVFAQIAAGTYLPNHMQYSRFLNPAEFKKKVQEATVIVAHAGMGSIIMALELGKPIVVMPRRGHLLETRNDHQVAAAKEFSSRGLVVVAQDESELAEKIDYANSLRLEDVGKIDRDASQTLINTIRSFIDRNVNPKRSTNSWQDRAKLLGRVFHQGIE